MFHEIDDMAISLAFYLNNTFDHCFCVFPTQKRRSECVREARRRQHRKHTKSQILVVICKIVGALLITILRVPPTQKWRLEGPRENASGAAPGGRSPLENVGRRGGAKRQFPTLTHPWRTLGAPLVHPWCTWPPHVRYIRKVGGGPYNNLLLETDL